MSASPYAPAWEFLQNASEYTDLEALQEGFGLAVGAFGFDRFSCTLIAKPGAPPSPAGAVWAIQPGLGTNTT